MFKTFVPDRRNTSFYMCFMLILFDPVIVTIGYLILFVFRPA